MSDEYIRKMKDKVDRSSNEELIYVVIPEILFVREQAIERMNEDLLRQTGQVLDYIGKRIDYEHLTEDAAASIVRLPLRRKSKTRVPSPNEIINGQGPKNSPNN
jgi:hypothetical protein